MNALAAMLVWCAVQVTALSTLFAAAYFALGGRSRAAAASLLAAGFVAVAAVTALCFSPWPCWCMLGDLARPASLVRGETAAFPQQSGDPGDAWNPNAMERSESQATGPLRPHAGQAHRAAAGLWDYVAAFSDALGHAQAPSADRTGWNWLSTVGGVAVAAAGLLVLRLLCGIWLVARWLRRSTAVDDAALVALVNECRGEMAIDKPVLVRVSTRVTTPATVGWRHPVILLPVTWREWSSEELRAVVAHELAHVQRGDFATGVLAELVRAVHFYHPLVHWLAARLRLDQELAADSMAAAFAGGPRCYLGSLARLAIREDDRPLGRLMQPFLPGAGTLTRRIDMLRSKRSEPHGCPVRRPTRVLLGALAAVAAIIIAGIRLPALPTGRAAVAAAAPARAALQQEQEQGGDTLNLHYISPQAAPRALVAIRPANLLGRAQIKKLLEQGGPAAQQALNAFEQFAGVPLGQVDQIIVLQFQTASQQGYIIRTTKAYDREKVASTLVHEATESVYQGKKFFQAKNDSLLSVYLPDDRTIVAAPAERLRPMMSASRGDAAGLRVIAELKNVDQSADFVVAVDTAYVAEGMTRQPQPNPSPPALTPLWEKTIVLVGSTSLREGMTSKLALVCADEPSTKPVLAAVEAAVNLGKAGLQALQKQPAAPVPGFDVKQLRPLLDACERVLANIKSRTEGNVVFVETQAAFDAPVALGFYLPAVAKAREAARRARCQSNLRQIGLAMQNYREEHGTFPPAVQVGNGGFKHSWRVLLLPDLGEDALYQRYHMNEPWDGPNNRKLIAEMPEVYKCPSGIHPNGHTDYAVMVGEGTVFPPGDQQGIRLQDITDGAGATLLVGEISGSAALSIPWTKPQDVELSDATVVPGAANGFSSMHEGGFNAAKADGSVSFQPLGIDPQMFRALFTRNAGD